MDRLKSLHTIRLALALGISILFLLQASGYLHIPMLNKLELAAYDTRVRLNLQSDTDPRIVIVDIDEKSLKDLGHWPWHRDQLAQLLRQLVDRYGVALVGFDMVFAEADDSSGLKVLEHLKQKGLRGHPRFEAEAKILSRQLNYDEIFAKSLEGRPVVLGYFFQSRTINTQHNIGRLPKPLQFNTAMPKKLPLVVAAGFGANLPRLQNAALNAGFIDIPIMDDDGIIRKVVLIQEYNGKYYSSLALSMALEFMQTQEIELLVAPGYDGDVNYGLEQIRIADSITIPVNERAATLIPYKRGYPAFPYISASDVISGRADPAALENAIVLVGTTAAGLLDNRNTPVQSVHPGVEIHASLISGILDQSLRHRPAYMLGVDVVALLSIALLLIWWLPRLEALGTLLLAAGLMLFMIGLNYLLWAELLLVAPIANQLVLITVLYVYYSSYGFFVEGRSKTILARRFGQYVPPEIVEEMSRQQGDYGLHGQTRNMTVMFVDIRSFTHIADSLEPRQLTQLMNIYLTEMTNVIHQHHGTVDKYIGDAIMAFWGAPLHNSNHARDALNASFEMRKGLSKLNEQLARKGLPNVDIGIGINSGEMSVGNMGSNFRMAYTVLGDAVNLASRFEGLTQYYHVPVIVGESMKLFLSDYRFRILDKVRFKGREGSTILYQPVCRQEDLTEEKEKELGEYHLAMQLYYQQLWSEAKSRFEKLCSSYPDDSIYLLYLERTQNMLDQPKIENWDKIWLHDTVKEVLQ
ncbi:MAG: adenylate/guanylate cyclase domain-containing protein [Gammaproteobacteria bacterium]|nr:adenylate/guanylate cyclase domain-containing protein [Gammaproteobacteria bacterium]